MHVISFLIMSFAALYSAVHTISDPELDRGSINFRQVIFLLCIVGVMLAYAPPRSRFVDSLITKGSSNLLEKMNIKVHMQSMKDMETFVS